MTIVYFVHEWLHIYCMHRFPTKLSTRLLQELHFSPGSSGRLIRMACLSLKREHGGRSMPKRPISSDWRWLHERHEPTGTKAIKGSHRTKATSHDTAAS